MFVLKNNNIWESTLAEFFEELDNGYAFNQKLISNFKNKVRYPLKDEEIESWFKWCYWFKKNERVFLNNLDKEVSIMIEYIVSRDNSRIDFIVSGKKTNNRYGSCIIEMKGWKKVNEMPYRLTVNAVDSDDQNERFHPSFQADSYKEEIIGWYKNKNNLPLDINSCVLMHELEKKDGEDKLEDKKFNECLQSSPVFYKNDAWNLIEYIKKNVHKHSSELNEWFKEIMYKPSIKKIHEVKSLQNVIENIPKNNSFLSSSQKRISNFVLKTIKTESTSKNNIFVIQGNAGTGKTIVALNLALELIREGKVFSLQLPGTDFRNGIENMFAREKILTKNVDIRGNFQSLINFENYWKTHDGIIIDEAHRLGNNRRITYNIIEAFLKQDNKNIILFLDLDQWCSAKSWLVSELKNIKGKYKVYINEDLILTDPFRYSFSNNYAEWLNSVIKSNMTPLVKTGDSKKFKISTKGKFLIIDDPTIFIKKFKDEVNKKENVRLLSTYYHNWTREIHLKNKDLNNLKVLCKDLSNILVKDVHIAPNISFPWYPFTNFDSYKVYLDGVLLNEVEAKKYRTIIKDEYEKNIERKKEKLSYIFNSNIGYQCVAYFNTVQGFEFDSIYVYVGKEMLYNEKTKEFEYNVKWDENRKLLKKYRQDLDWKNNSMNNKLELLKNQLKVLLSRGKNKVTIYCEDKNTSEYFKKYLLD